MKSVMKKEWRQLDQVVCCACSTIMIAFSRYWKVADEARDRRTIWSLIRLQLQATPPPAPSARGFNPRRA
jgi:hypothetical protein